MLWDITTKFLPVEDLIRSQLFTNFDGYSLKNGAATPLTIWNFSRAWQAYFLSNNLQIWWENTSFNDLQMIWNNVFDTSIGFWFEKIWLSCTVHFYSLYLTYYASKRVFLKHLIQKHKDLMAALDSLDFLLMLVPLYPQTHWCCQTYLYFCIKLLTCKKRTSIKYVHSFT